LSFDKLPIAHRFRGYLPVVLDLETGGFNHKTDALLESAIVIPQMNDEGNLVPGERMFFNIEPLPVQI
jgi:ribonuclease T